MPRGRGYPPLRVKKEVSLMHLKGKKVIAIGERDGVQGPAIAECVRSAGGEAVLVTTQCYV